MLEVCWHKPEAWKITEDISSDQGAERSANGGFLPLALPCHGACGLGIVKGETASATAPKEPPLTIARPRGIGAGVAQICRSNGGILHLFLRLSRTAA